MILIFAAFTTASAGLSYEKYNLVDYKSHDNNTTNYLFRSNEPITNNTFQYNEILNFTQQRLKEDYNMMLDESVYLVDINLLQDVGEEHDFIDIEEDFFAKNPSLGRVWRHSTIGNVINPNYLPTWILKLALKVYEHANWDQLPVFIPQIREDLMTQKNQSTIYLIHC